MEINFSLRLTAEFMKLLIKLSDRVLIWMAIFC